MLRTPSTAILTAMATRTYWHEYAANFIIPGVLISP